MKNNVILLLMVIISLMVFLACTNYDAENDFQVESVDNGRSVRITEYVGAKSKLRIPPKINKLPITYIGENAFRGKNLISVTIPNSVTHIEKNAFRNNQLTNINIPDSVTHIENGAFALNRLINLTIPSSVIYIGDGAFLYNRFTSINIPESVTHIGYFPFAFDQLTNINIPENVRITYYISDNLKVIHPLPGEIENILKEFADFSQGKMQLNIVDPMKANLAGYIEQIGITPQQIQTVEKGIITVYTGIAIEYLEKVDVLPLVVSLEMLEYDITLRIRTLVQAIVPKLGVIIGDNFRDWNDDFRRLQNVYTQAGYQFQMIIPGQNIPESLSALMVLGGVETLDEVCLYQIDHYIQNGGKAFFAVKGIHIDTQAGIEARLLKDKGLLSMLSGYGVTVLPEIAMDKSALTMQYQTRTPSGAVQFRITRYPQWIRVLGENGNPSHPASAHFGGLDLYWASPLYLNSQNGVNTDYLFTSTAEAWSMREPFSTSPENASLFERDANKTMGKKVLGASLTGVFPSWFKGKPKPEQNGGITLPDMPSQSRTTQIIIVGDIDFATSFMNVTGGQHNLDFMIQATNWLCYDDDVIIVR